MPFKKKKKKAYQTPFFFEALTEACTDRRPTCTLPTVPPGLRWAPGSCPPWWSSQPDGFPALEVFMAYFSG